MHGNCTGCYPTIKRLIEFIGICKSGSKIIDITYIPIIDIRDMVELQNTGRIENSFNIPRGMLEFSIHPESPFFKKEKIDPNKEMVLFCAAGGRSALAAKTLQDMGFEKVSHVDGGFSLMINSGFKIV